MIWDFGILLALDKVMKVLILILFIFSFYSQASQFEYVIGGVTPHIKSPPNNNLCNQIIPNSGVIFTRLHSYRFEKENFGAGALVGENSYCQEIWGATSYYKLYQNRNLQIHSTVGFYHFDAKGFDFAQGSYFAKIDNFYFVPVAGVEVNLNLYQSKDFQIKMVNLLTPIVFNHSVGIYFDI